MTRTRDSFSESIGSVLALTREDRRDVAGGAGSSAAGGGHWGATARTIIENLRQRARCGMGSKRRRVEATTENRSWKQVLDGVATEDAVPAAMP